MEKMNDLKALLRHEIKDIMSAEDQIIAALPLMIEKAGNQHLKNALEQHLTVTEIQRERLNEVQGHLGEPSEESKGFFKSLFGGGAQKCKAMEGIIAEGKTIMGENMSTAVMDAAIIAAAQKVEHYEIASYGTVVSYANQLGETEVAQLLAETLTEEYDADDILTALAENEVNKRAEKKRGGGKANSPKKAKAVPKSANKKAASKK